MINNLFKKEKKSTPVDPNSQQDSQIFIVTSKAKSKKYTEKYSPRMASLSKSLILSEISPTTPIDTTAIDVSFQALQKQLLLFPVEINELQLGIKNQESKNYQMAQIMMNFCLNETFQHSVEKYHTEEEIDEKIRVLERKIDELDFEADELLRWADEINAKIEIN